MPYPRGLICTHVHWWDGVVGELETVRIQINGMLGGKVIQVIRKLEVKQKGPVWPGQKIFIK